MTLGFYSPTPIVLPHPPYPIATLIIIERAIQEAWRIIRDEPQGGFTMAVADEDTITRELRSCLVDRVLVGGVIDGFSYKHFRVIREGKFESFDGQHLDKMPDLYIDVVRDTAPSLPSVDGLFVECKPVDRKHPAGVDYCGAGIIRFVIGQYAWAMPQALMIGYASAGYTLPNKLRTALGKRKTELKPKGKLKRCSECSAKGYAQHPHISVHRRGFIYPSTGTEAPDITLRHLWLYRN
jgi:hypothetical protein